MICTISSSFSREVFLWLRKKEKKGGSVGHALLNTESCIVVYLFARLIVDGFHLVATEQISYLFLPELYNFIMPFKRICVFCGASPGSDPVFVQSAEELALEFKKRDIHLVYGGGGVGMMGAIARKCLDVGLEVDGVIPR